MTSTWVPFVDVSEYQGRIDFAAMKATGVEAVAIRCGLRVAIDDRAFRNRDAARRAGMPAGPYWWTDPRPTAPSALEQADMVREVCGAFGPWELPLTVDVEQRGRGRTPADRDPTPAEWAAFLPAFFDRLGPEWAPPIVYTGTFYWTTIVRQPAPPGSALVLARYPVSTPEGYAAHPLPGPEGWVEWAFGRQSNGPRGALFAEMPWTEWDGWQFSAEANGQARRYGCQGDDLDLDLMRRTSFVRLVAAGPYPRVVAPPPPVPPTPPAPAPGPPAPVQPPERAPYGTWPVRVKPWLVKGRVRAADRDVVRYLQAVLRDHGGAPRLVVDGRYGRRTRAAVARFQRAHRLVVTWKVGPATWAAIDKEAVG